MSPPPILPPPLVPRYPQATAHSLGARGCQLVQHRRAVIAGGDCPPARLHGCVVKRPSDCPDRLCLSGDRLRSPCRGVVIVVVHGGCRASLFALAARDATARAWRSASPVRLIGGTSPARKLAPVNAAEVLQTGIPGCAVPGLMEMLLAARVRGAGVDLATPELVDTVATTTQCCGNAVLRREPD